MKNNTLHNIFFLLIFSAALPLWSQEIRFNEVQSFNTQYFDEDGDTPDWFELYNRGNDGVSLGGWTVTDDKSIPDKWAFPSMAFEADSYLLVWASGKDRSQNGIPRTLITQGDAFRFLIPNQTVNSQWITLGFDDSAWNEGASGFGYGDGDDATNLPSGLSSVFLRKRFNLADADAIESLILHVDYDDAFVAYINGIEVARANINGLPPAFNATANTDHEAIMYGGGTPDRFEINNIGGLLQTGENVLCVQAHNTSVNSSDFSIIPFLTAVYDVSTNEGIVPPAVLQVSEYALHTNFKITSDGETLYLFDEMGSLVDSLVIGQMPLDVSYGVAANDTDLVYFDSPTPGLPNAGNEYVGINQANIQFSHPGGKTGSLSLTLSGTSAPATIHYTLDATVPNENSPVYTGPIFISSNRVVRARMFRQDYLPSQTQSHTYLVNATHDLPVISLVTEPYNFFDNDYGMYVLGDDHEFDFPYFGSNFWEDWERLIHFTFYEKDGSLGTSFDGGVKIFGGWSRANDQRSLSIFARSEYGINEINYPLFPDQDYDKYQALVLRNSGNDWLNTMLRDGALTGLMKGSGLDYQAFRPAATYLNGDYWGFYNMREKINEHFIASKHSLDADNINLLEGNGWTIHGDNQDYLDLIGFVESNNLASANNYQFVKDRIDVENYIIYQVAQIYFDNTDWPGNNVKFWKANNGKWRWILFDTDFGFGIWNTANYLNNTIEFALQSNGPGWPNPPWSTLLFRKLVQNIEFRNELVNRFADELNSRFLPERVCEHIDSLRANISSEINRHYIRWGGSIPYWNDQVANMKAFAEERPAFLKNHILEEFGLTTYYPLTIQNDDPSKGYVKVNRLTIKDTNWQGDYFQGVPIKVVAIPEPGYVFSHWSGASASTNAALGVDMISALTLIPHFDFNPSIPLSIVINEINYNSNDDFDTGDWVELHNPNPYFVDLSGWGLKDDDDSHNYIFPQGTILEGGGFLVLANDLSKFKTFYPTMENVMGEFDFGLSSNGDAVRLYDQNNQLQDVVNYLPTSPWPTGANGEGPTLELIGPSLDNSLPENWANVHEKGSPSESNIDVADSVASVDLGEFQHYPNPFTDEINIAFSLHQSTHVNATLYNMNGALVHTIFEGVLVQGEHILKADLGFLERGVYILHIKELNGQGCVLKWIKL